MTSLLDINEIVLNYRNSRLKIAISIWTIHIIVKYETMIDLYLVGWATFPIKILFVFEFFGIVYATEAML